VLGEAHSEIKPAAAGVAASLKSVIGVPHVFADDKDVTDFRGVH
jgi:hypothetical protein